MSICVNLSSLQCLQCLSMCVLFNGCSIRWNHIIASYPPTIRDAAGTQSAFKHQFYSIIVCCFRTKVLLWCYKSIEYDSSLSLSFRFPFPLLLSLLCIALFTSFKVQMIFDSKAILFVFVIWSPAPVRTVHKRLMTFHIRCQYNHLRISTSFTLHLTFDLNVELPNLTFIFNTIFFFHFQTPNKTHHHKTDRNGAHIDAIIWSMFCIIFADNIECILARWKNR